MLGDRRLLQTIRLQNFLSFDESSEEIELKSLNVLIGPNASGKSNLIEAVGLLKATPNDLMSPIRDGGGVGEWIWKGRPATSFSLTTSPHEHTLPVAEIDATVCYPQSKARMPLRHRIAFKMVGQRFELVSIRKPRFFKFTSAANFTLDGKIAAVW